MNHSPRVLHLTTVDMSLALLLGPQLQAFQAAGYDVIGASAPGPYRADIEALGVRFEPLSHFTRSMAPGHDALALVELVRLLRRVRPDVLHTHNPKPGLLGRLAGRLTRIPVVVNTTHGLYAQPEDRAAKRRIVYGLERVAAMASDAELVQNPDDLATLRSIGIPARKLHLLGNGIDLSRFDPAAVDPVRRQAMRAELAERPDQLICGVIGRLVWEKGLQEVFDAAEQLRRTHPAVQFVVVGPLDPEKADGLRAEDLVRITEKTGIRFTGPRRDVEDIYPALDVFVLASHREGFPRTPMEASAMGIPVVITDIRGCREVVEDGVNGLLVPPRDSRALAAAIATLADDPARRAAMGAAGIERAGTHFNQDRVIDLTLETYRRLLGDRAPVAAPSSTGP